MNEIQSITSTNRGGYFMPINIVATSSNDKNNKNGGMNYEQSNYYGQTIR